MHASSSHSPYAYQAQSAAHAFPSVPHHVHAPSQHAHSQVHALPHAIPPPQHGDVNNAHSASPSSDAGQRHVGVAPLRRGQACQACRRRKLKCDAVRPVCGTCEKSRKAAALANHVSPVPDGDCVYDDVPVGAGSDGQAANGMVTPTGVEERAASKRQRMSGGAAMHDGRAVSSTGSELGDVGGSSSSSNVTAEQRVMRLESRIVELEDKLRQARTHGASSSASGHNWETGTTPRRWRSRASSREPEDSFRPAVPIISMLSPLSGREERHRMRYFQRPARLEGANTITGLHGQMEAPSYVSSSLSRSVPLFSNMGEAEQQISAEQMLDTVRRSELTGTAQLSPTDEAFMQLLWPGWSSELPSAETVTTLCETFFRLHPLRTLIYKPSFMSGLLLPPRHPHRPHDSLIHAVLSAAADLSPFFENSTMISGVRDRFAVLLADPFSRPNLQQPQSADMLTFKEFHLSKARQKVERSLITDFRNPLDWLSACVLTCYVLWNDGRFVESYFLSSFIVRAVAPSGLDKLPARHFSPSGKVKNSPGIFGDPQGIEEHERRVIFWHVFIADQYTSGPPGFYENLLSEQAILTHLPCKMSDFLAGNDVAPNAQTLTSSDLFSKGHLDDFTLHIKSAVLLRRASTLSCRSQLSRSKPSGVPIIDRHIDEFLANFPSTPLQNSTADGLNAYANISLALFYLHEPYLSKSALCTVREAEPAPTSSNGRILLGFENMMRVLHELMNSSLDFALLHAQMFLTWSVAARMIGKDMMLLQQRQQAANRTENGQSTPATNGNAEANGIAAESKRRLAPDETAALSRTMENLDLIVQALRRGGIKSNKARRCSELVSSVRSGHLHENYLTHLLYLDGVIPVDEIDTSAEMPDLGSDLTSMQPSAFDMLMQTSATDIGDLQTMPIVQDINLAPSGAFDKQSISMDTDPFTSFDNTVKDEADPTAGLDAGPPRASQEPGNPATIPPPQALQNGQEHTIGNDALLNFAV